MIKKCLAAIILLIFFTNVCLAQEEIKDSFYKSFGRIRFPHQSSDTCIIATANIEFVINKTKTLVYTVSGDSEKINKTLNDFLNSSNFNSTYILNLLTKYKEVILPVYYSFTGYQCNDCLTIESINLNETINYPSITIKPLVVQVSVSCVRKGFELKDTVPQIKQPLK